MPERVQKQERHARARHDFGFAVRVAQIEVGRASAKAVVEIDHEGDLAALSIGPLEAAVLVRFEGLARLVAIVAQPLRETIEERLSKYDTTLKLSERPAIVLVVGVNGVGKTTTIGKFAKFVRNFDRTVIVGAADTFRAAAVEQVATWAERAGAEVQRPQQEGQDPASVAFQTVQRAKDEGIEIVLIDTAGRLQTKGGLMDELAKIKRVVEKQAPISEVLLVLDATTGQNGLAQAQAFLEQAGVTGLVLTKLDGSAKGGFVLNVQERTGLPIKLVGQGEGIGDLTGFTPHVFAQQLVG